MALRATVDRPVWLLLVIVAYVAAFGMFGLALQLEIPVGVAYGIWGASGVALVAVLGVILFDEALSLPAIAGIALILLGVVVVETGSPHQPAAMEESE